MLLLSQELSSALLCCSDWLVSAVTGYTETEYGGCSKVHGAGANAEVCLSHCALYHPFLSTLARLRQTSKRHCAWDTFSGESRAKVSVPRGGGRQQRILSSFCCEEIEPVVCARADELATAEYFESAVQLILYPPAKKSSVRSTNVASQKLRCSCGGANDGNARKSLAKRVYTLE